MVRLVLFLLLIQLHLLVQSARLYQSLSVRLDLSHQMVQWDRLGLFYSSPGFVREEMHAFLARDLKEVAADPEADEDISLEWCPLAGLLAAPQDVEDAKSLAALLLVERLLEGEGRPKGKRKA